jgi:hypothetical protein
MFQNLTISEDDAFKKHLNKYEVIHLDIRWCCMDAEKGMNMYVLSKKLKKYRTEIYKEPMEKR